LVVQPFQYGDARMLRLGGSAAAQPLQARLIVRYQFLCLRSALQGRAHVQHIFPNISQPIRGQRDNARLNADQLRNGARHVALADGANFALGLCEDDVGEQPLQLLDVDAVDAQRVQRSALFLRCVAQGFDLRVDLGAASVDVNLHPAHHRQRLHRFRIIAFM
jgi:hypothetical protein